MGLITQSTSAMYIFDQVMSFVKLLIMSCWFCRNMTYDYLVEASYDSHTVLMEVVDCEMEADKNGNCYYDKLSIYDGLLLISLADPGGCTRPNGHGPLIFYARNAKFSLFFAKPFNHILIEIGSKHA